MTSPHPVVAYVQLRLEGRADSPRRRSRKPRTAPVEPAAAEAPPLRPVPTPAPVLPRQRQPEPDGSTVAASPNLV
jgi:hypothetical protein